MCDLGWAWRAHVPPDPLSAGRVAPPLKTYHLFSFLLVYLFLSGRPKYATVEFSIESTDEWKKAVACERWETTNTAVQHK